MEEIDDQKLNSMQGMRETKLLPKPKRFSVWKIIILAIIAIVVLFLAVQVINAAKYKMVVNVVEGENIMGINPTAEKLDFGDLSRNNGMTRYITISNNGSFRIYVIVWKMGNISDLINVSRNFFVLGSGQEEKLGFEINIPPSAQTKKYSGRVWIFRLPKPF